MRDTKYATEIATGTFDEYRVERLFVKAKAREEIRFSWWPGGHFMDRALDVTEGELLSLLQAGLKAKVFSDSFLADLRATLNDHLDIEAPGE